MFLQSNDLLVVQEEHNNDADQNEAGNEQLSILNEPCQEFLLPVWEEKEGDDSTTVHSNNNNVARSVQQQHERHDVNIVVVQQLHQQMVQQQQQIDA